MVIENRFRGDSRLTNRVDVPDAETPRVVTHESSGQRYAVIFPLSQQRVAVVKLLGDMADRKHPFGRDDMVEVLFGMATHIPDKEY